jgi:hypothetical protein
LATVYISGGMTGFPGFRFDEFDRVARKFRSDGHAVFNPAEHDRQCYRLNPDDFPTGDFSDANWPQERIDTFMRHALMWDCKAICRSDWFVILPDSENSKGTAVELSLAKRLGLRIIYLGRGE